MPVPTTTPSAPRSNRRRIWASRIISAGALVAGGWFAANRLADAEPSSDLTTTNSTTVTTSLPAAPTNPAAVPATVPTVVLTTDPPPITIPVETQPPATAPPATAPPATAPPATAPPATRPPATAAPAADTVTCRNVRYDYSIDYPSSWYTSDGGDPHLTCAWFDPLPFDPAEMFEIDVAIATYYIDENIDQMAEWEFDPVLVTVLDRAEIVLDGHRTIVAVVEFTGGAYWPAGWIGYFYLIDWDGQTFMMMTAGMLDDIDAYGEVLDDMAASLRLGVALT